MQSRKEKIKEIKKQIKTLQSESDKIQNKLFDLYQKINKLEDEEYAEKVTKKYKIGDIVVNNMGITNYHCNVLVMYEILNILPNIKTRVYTIGYADGDYYSRIRVENNLSFSDLGKGKKVSAKEAEDIKKIITDPDSYETSVWNISK